MDSLIQQFNTFSTITHNNNLLHIIGKDDNYGPTTFISAYRSPIWNEILCNTQIIMENIMVETTDNEYGGDKWCVDWMRDYFKGNLKFINCHYVIKMNGMFVNTGLVK